MSLENPLTSGKLQLVTTYNVHNILSQFSYLNNEYYAILAVAKNYYLMISYLTTYKENGIKKIST